MVEQGEDEMEKLFVVVLAVMVMAVSIGCGEEETLCLNPYGDECIKQSMEDGDYPSIDVCEPKEFRLGGQQFSTGQTITVDTLWNKAVVNEVGIVWSSDGRTVFVTFGLLDGFQEFGVLVEPNLLEYVMGLEQYKNAVSFGCDMKTDVDNMKDIQAMWDQGSGQPVFICADWPKDVWNLPTSSRVIYVGMPTGLAEYNMGDEYPNVPSQTTIEVIRGNKWVVITDEAEATNSGDYAFTLCN